MKSMNRLVPSPRKAKKKQERMRRTDAFVDAIIEELQQRPLEERQEIVDLVASFKKRTKGGTQKK
jgi:hypothetical protein